MTDFKSFKLPGDATLRIRSEKIVATLSSNGGQNVDIYCDGVSNPFHIQTTKKTPSELTNYIWNIPNPDSEDND